MSQTKKRIAVFIGGRSPEHDVSVVTGLQALKAIDPSKYDAFPVYITPQGEWLIGDVLRDRNNYMLDKNNEKKTTVVTLDINRQKRGRKGVLRKKKSSLFSNNNIADTFDAALLCFHGLYGEDGPIQGVFELAGIPYSGTRLMGSTILMDKIATKYILKALDIPALPYAVLHRPKDGFLISEKEIEATLKAQKIKFPIILKPTHLGSSIGVARAETLEEARACLPTVFEYDDSLIIEPFVENMVEYNVSTLSWDGQTITSAIERPKTNDELLDFKQKYLSGGDNKTGTKNPGQISEGMLSLTREINPKITKKQEKNIREWASKVFEAFGSTGCARTDFIGNAKTGEIWLNEVNPIPGSLGYFLWEANKEQPILFSELLTRLIEEAFEQNKKRRMPDDPVPKDARLFKRSV